MFVFRKHATCTIKTRFVLHKRQLKLHIISKRKIHCPRTSCDSHSHLAITRTQYVCVCMYEFSMYSTIASMHAYIHTPKFKYSYYTIQANIQYCIELFFLYLAELLALARRWYFLVPSKWDPLKGVEIASSRSGYKYDAKSTKFCCYTICANTCTKIGVEAYFSIPLIIINIHRRKTQKQRVNQNFRQ